MAVEPLDIGTVEAETRAFIAGLGKLSPRYRTLAAQAIAVAHELDRADCPAGAKSSLDRRLTQDLDRLREAEHAVKQQTPGEDVEDEVEKARKARAERLTGQQIQEGNGS